MPKIAIISDTHDQIANLRAAVQYCNHENVELLLHCGDLISPFMLKELGDFNGRTHLIYGNNAGDQHLISSRCATEYSRITHHGTLGILKFGGLNIALVHYPELARGLAMHSCYDVVCYGHNHVHSVECYGQTLLINPGHLLGEDDQTGFTLLDCDSRSTQRIRIGACMFDTEIRIWPEPATLPAQEEILNRQP
jgi:hypothetical protein